MPDTRPRLDGSVPIKLLHDRVLVREGGEDGERRSSGGIVIPATAQVGFEPEDRGTVELQGIDYVLLRERDLHAVASSRHATSGTGLYL